MIFGSKTRFAVESAVHEPVSNYGFGQICFWANDKQLGAYEQTIILNSISDFLRGTRRFQGQRHDTTLLSLPPEKALDVVYSALYGDPERGTSDHDIHEQWRRYSKFCICPNGCEAFDGELAILLEGPQGEERFIWRELSTKSVYEIRLE